MISFVDSHTHLFDTQFDEDRPETVARAIEAGVKRMFLPNIDTETIAPMLAMAQRWPDNCFPMLGLHPCSVKEDYEVELSKLYAQYQGGIYYAIGEIGLDFYWDVTFKQQQIEAFKRQIQWALEWDLPIAIHTRNSFNEALDVVSDMQNGKLNGVFHCFGGSVGDAERVLDLGFYIGIGGVATFKNGHLEPVLKEIDLSKILLETDSPYLAPVPYRGKRNESAHIPIIAQKIADVKGVTIEEVAKVTTENALTFFKTNV